MQYYYDDLGRRVTHQPARVLCPMGIRAKTLAATFKSESGVFGGKEQVLGHSCTYLIDRLRQITP